MLTVIYCPLCNWKSEEIPVATKKWWDEELGRYWPCGNCAALIRHYIEYAEDNREEALRQLNKLL
jgi:hypothetical protein